MTEVVQQLSHHMTQAELARYWRISARSLERWRAERRGPAWVRIGGRIIYRFEDVLAYERAHLQQP